MDAVSRDAKCAAETRSVSEGTRADCGAIERTSEAKCPQGGAKGGMAFGAHERGALRPLRALRFARGFPPKQSFFGACHGRGAGRARAERIPTVEAHRRMPP